MERKSKIGPIAEAVLATVAVGGLVSIMALAPGAAVVLAPFLKKKKYQPKQVIGRNIDSLIKNGLLREVRQKDGSVMVELTKKGYWEAGIRGYIKSFQKAKSSAWDQQWRIIIFDVPENKRKLRNELRRAVELFGFVRLQQSVWVYPYPCSEFTKLVKEHLGISVEVLNVTASYIENDKWLKKEFKLE